MSDIGHFSKSMSKGFCAFKDKNSEFTSVSLLDLNRIIAISSDVPHHLKRHNKLDERN